jgi:phosphoglycerate dehydrogenase-like enzyme
MAVLGLGTIGEEVARRALAWGMRVIGTKARPSDYQGVAEEVTGPEGTVEVCRRADTVVCALPASPETAGLVGAEALSALGAGWLVNVGRGSAVDVPALLEALEAGELRGAGLDVFPEEPLPATSPLWSHPRVVLTPHTAGLSPAYGPRLADLLRANLAGYTGAGVWATRVV